jgi:hypothetical protein
MLISFLVGNCTLHMTRESGGRKEEDMQMQLLFSLIELAQELSWYCTSYFVLPSTLFL